MMTCKKQCFPFVNICRILLTVNRAVERSEIRRWGARNNVVGKICPMAEIGLTDLLKTGEALSPTPTHTPTPSAPTALVKPSHCIGVST